MADRMGYKKFLNDRVGRAFVFANACHNPPGPGGGQFCSDELGSVGNNVSLVDLEKHHGERIPGLKRVIGVIDSIHVMPDLYPKVSVEVWSEMGGAHGAYDPGERLIKLAEDSPYNISTFAHEFGHHLSLEFGESKLEFLNKVKKDPELSVWLDAVRATPQHRILLEAEGHGDNHASYLRDSRELFSRSYAQWLGVKAAEKGSTVLKYQHDKIREKTKGIFVWSDEEFKPIGQALESWFEKKGLLR